MQFVAVTHGGLLGAVAPTAELGERLHPLSPLFYAAHGVIKQIRLTLDTGAVVTDSTERVVHVPE